MLTITPKMILTLCNLHMLVFYYTYYVAWEDSLEQELVQVNCLQLYLC